MGRPPSRPDWAIAPHLALGPEFPGQTGSLCVWRPRRWPRRAPPKAAACSPPAPSPQARPRRAGRSLPACKVPGRAAQQVQSCGSHGQCRITCVLISQTNLAFPSVGAATAAFLHVWASLLERPRGSTSCCPPGPKSPRVPGTGAAALCVWAVGAAPAVAPPTSALAELRQLGARALLEGGHYIPQLRPRAGRSDTGSEPPPPRWRLVGLGRAAQQLGPSPDRAVGM